MVDKDIAEALIRRGMGASSAPTTQPNAIPFDPLQAQATQLEWAKVQLRANLALQICFSLPPEGIETIEDETIGVANKVLREILGYSDDSSGEIPF